MRILNSIVQLNKMNRILKTILITLLCLLACLEMSAQDKIKIGLTYELPSEHYRLRARPGVTRPLLNAINEIYNPKYNYPFLVVEKIEEAEVLKYIDPPLNHSCMYFRVWLDYFSIISKSYQPRTYEVSMIIHRFNLLLSNTTRCLFLYLPYDKYEPAWDIFGERYYMNYPPKGIENERFGISIPIVYLQDFIYDFNLLDINFKYDFDTHQAFGVTRKLPFMICTYDSDIRSFIEVKIIN